MTKKEQREKSIFESFEQRHPEFAGRKITWVPGNDPPDILCTDEVGKRIGVELGEWINEDQMRDAKRREGVEDSYRSAIRSREVAHPSNIGMVQIGAKEATKIAAAETQRFHDEMYALVEQIDQDWPPRDLKYNPNCYVHYDFSGYPILAKYLHMLEFIPTAVNDPPNGFEWIDFRYPGGAYSSQSAIDALSELIAKKTAKYEGLHGKEKLTELYLVAYFDRGLFYNTPYDTSTTGFKEIAYLGSQWLKTKAGKFQRVFLFDSTGDGKVVRLL